MCYTPCQMREEIPRNEDVIFDQQTAKVKNHQKNAARRQVRPMIIITWYLLALIAICLWTLSLFGVISLPF